MAAKEKPQNIEVTKKASALTPAYAELVPAKGHDLPGGSRRMWYRIFYDLDRRGPLTGPYRDATDAENAAHDEAERRGLELEWVY